MGMSSPMVAGQLSDLARTASTRIPEGGHDFNRTSSLEHILSLNKRVPGTQMGRTSTSTTIIPRKSLPWLDKGRKLPGAFDSTLELGTLPATESAAVQALPKEPPSEPSAIVKRPTLNSLDGDPSFRAIGSTPSLRKSVRPANRPRSLSLSLEPRPGAKLPVTKQQVRRALGVQKDKQAKAEEYTPSEYSTTISSDADGTPPAVPPPPARGTPAYQRQVQKAVNRKQKNAAPLDYVTKTEESPKQQTNPGPFQFAQDWLQSQLDLPFEEVAPLSVKKKCQRSDSDCECDKDMPFGESSPKTTSLAGPLASTTGPKNKPALAPPIRSVIAMSQPSSTPVPKPSWSIVAGQLWSGASAVKRSGTMLPKPTRDFVKDSPWPDPPPPKQAIARKETLHPMPSHLMFGSSSSSDIPSHLMTSTDVSNAPSPTLSPRGTLKQPLPLQKPVATANRELRHETRDLNNAVAGLERLMEDALQAAKDAETSGRPDQVKLILDGATTALRKASQAALVSPRSIDDHHVYMTGPLQLSPHHSSCSSDGDSNDGVHGSGYSSLQHSREWSMETAPTLITAQSSQQPLLAEPYTNKEGRAPEAHRAVLEGPAVSGGDFNTRAGPRLYQPHSADSIVHDFAYATKYGDPAKAQAAQSQSPNTAYGSAADFYDDHGESVTLQPGNRNSIALADMAPKRGIRRSIALARMPGAEEILPQAPNEAHQTKDLFGRVKRQDTMPGSPRQRRQVDKDGLRQLEPQSTNITRGDEVFDDVAPEAVPRLGKNQSNAPHVTNIFGSPNSRNLASSAEAAEAARKLSSVTDARSVDPLPSRSAVSFEQPTKDDARKHISLREGQGFSLGRYHRRQPIAREWNDVRKRIAAAIACANTVFIGLIAGIYAGEVPAMQYQIADTSHKVILGNVLLFAGLGLTTLIFWPLPLLHGRKPYTLMAFAIMLPLQFPQALAIASNRDPTNPLFRLGLLIPRIFTGMAMGFANINQLPTLFDLFGCSLMSERPHQEIVTVDDIRRQGGGVGIWLGIWSFCFIGSLSIGFCIGACIISALDPSWGFYIVVLLLAFFLMVNVIAPETRRAPYRRSIAHFFEEEDGNQKLRRRVARGEVSLHISNEGPKWWFQEVWAGIILTKRMVCQPGFFVLMLYIGWMYAQVTMVILLLGALLSRDYRWQPQYVGLASLALAIGALLAVPLAKASIFSRARFTPQRTDSMTMHAPRLQ